MPSDVTNRQTIREKIGSLLATKFGVTWVSGTASATDGDWDIFGFGTFSFNGKARNVSVASFDTDYLSEGSEAEETTNSDAEMDFRIIVSIQYANDTLSWTAKNSEDALDLGRKRVADCIRDNRDNASWYRLKRNGRSTVGVTEDIAGVPYRYEIIPVRVVLYP